MYAATTLLSFCMWLLYFFIHFIKMMGKYSQYLTSESMSCIFDWLRRAQWLLKQGRVNDLTLSFLHFGPSMCTKKGGFLSQPLADCELFMSSNCCRFIFQKCVVGNRIYVFLPGKGEVLCKAHCVTVGRLEGQRAGALLARWEHRSQQRGAPGHCFSVSLKYGYLICMTRQNEGCSVSFCLLQVLLFWATLVVSSANITVQRKEDSLFRNKYFIAVNLRSIYGNYLKNTWYHFCCEQKLSSTKE